MQDKKVRNSCRAFCELSDKAVDDGCDFATKPSEQLPERLGGENEARVGIEPTNTAFAEPCLTTWLPRRDGKIYIA